MPTAFAPTTHHPITAPSHSVGEKIVSGLRRTWQDFRDWRARRATVAALQGLDDHTLHDLGLSRSEVESVVYDDAGEHLRRYDPGWHRQARGGRSTPKMPDIM
jgi:uncharacterized protein YjiS (DUF1127 family)